VSDIGNGNHRIRVQLPQNLTAAIDAWAEAHHTNRSDAIRQLVELGLKFARATSSQHAIKDDALAIEDEAIGRIRALLDPSLPPEERERRIRRLVEGPPEFSAQRVDLPHHKK
jgi:Arc/MetJ-type ribon-helix-helix transcriptional regulator